MPRARTPRQIDIYTILGVEPTADADTLRRAYRKRALELHPDVRPDDPKAATEFSRLKQAYDIALERLTGQPEGPRFAPDQDGSPEPRRSRSRWAQNLADQAAESGRTREQREADYLTRLRNPQDLTAAAGEPLTPMVAAALATNPALPASALALLRKTSPHWTVDAAIAARPDCPIDLLNRIGRVHVRERLVDLALASNPASFDDLLLAILDTRADSEVLRRIANRGSWSPYLRDRLYKTGDIDVMCKLVTANALDEAQLRELAGRGPVSGDLRTTLAGVFMGRGWAIPDYLESTLNTAERTALAEHGAIFASTRTAPPVATPATTTPGSPNREKTSDPSSSQHTNGRSESSTTLHTATRTAVPPNHLRPIAVLKKHPIVRTYLAAIDRFYPVTTDAPAQTRQQAGHSKGLSSIPPPLEEALMSLRGVGRLDREEVIVARHEISERGVSFRQADDLLRQPDSWRFPIGVAMLRVLEDRTADDRARTIHEAARLTTSTELVRLLAFIDAAPAWPRRSWPQLIMLADDARPVVRARAREIVGRIEAPAACMVQAARALDASTQTATGNTPPLASCLRGAADATLRARQGRDRALCQRMLRVLQQEGGEAISRELNRLTTIPHYQSLAEVLELAQPQAAGDS